MRLRKGLFVLALGLVAASGTAAWAVPIYNATTGETFIFDFGAGVTGVPTLEDVNLPAGTAPVTVRSMSFGYSNATSDPLDADAIVTFWDNVNSAASGSQAVNSASLGSVRVPLGLIAGDQTAILEQFNLDSPIGLADNALGVSIGFVEAGTNTPAEVVALLTADAPTVGTSNPVVWIDNFPQDGTFIGDESTAGSDDARLYLLLDGAAVPEPGVAAVLGLGAAWGLVARRYRVG
jgi:hypothetical protein